MLAIALAESDIFDIDGNQRKARDLLLRGIVGKDPPCGWHHNPVEVTVIVSVIDALSASENIYGVLVPSQQAILSETMKFARAYDWESCCQGTWLSGVAILRPLRARGRVPPRQSRDRCRGTGL